MSARDGQSTRESGRTRGGRLSRLSAQTLSAIAVMLVAGVASAQQTQIYATYGADDRGPGGPIGLGSVPPTSIHLWVWSGSTPSSGPPCQVGATGRELCGVMFELVATGGFQIVDFVANPGFDSSSQALAFNTSPLPGSTLIAQNFDLGAPTIENRYLGAIVVTGTAITPVSKIEVRGRVVRSNLEIGDVIPADLLVPEPGLLASLVAGALGLVWAARGRGRVDRRIPRGYPVG